MVTVMNHVKNVGHTMQMQAALHLSLLIQILIIVLLQAGKIVLLSLVVLRVTPILQMMVLFMVALMCRRVIIILRQLLKTVHANMQAIQ